MNTEFNKLCEMLSLAKIKYDIYDARILSRIRVRYKAGCISVIHGGHVPGASIGALEMTIVDSCGNIQELEGGLTAKSALDKIKELLK